METIKFQSIDCIRLQNSVISLLVTRSVGPRIISLGFKGGDNLFAELPDFVTERPDGKLFHFYGGHRLWHAPESMPRTYFPDDGPVDVVQDGFGFSISSALEDETGIEKSIQISLAEDKPQVILHHFLTNRGLWPIDCAPWAITQLRTGGVAILPQSQQQAGFLPNRSLALWSYTDFASPHVFWGNEYILVHANMEKPFKVGFPNPRGWLAYWLDGTLFVKRTGYDALAKYYDFGSSSECYCNDRFLELETLAPVEKLAPGESVKHTETWELYKDVDFPESEGATKEIVATLGLE